EAGNELTLKAGGSFIKLDPGGVSLVGPQVKINAGGSAGKGSGFTLLSPRLSTRTILGLQTEQQDSPKTSFPQSLSETQSPYEQASRSLTGCAACGKPIACETAIDFDFISELEGGLLLEG